MKPSPRNRRILPSLLLSASCAALALAAGCGLVRQWTGQDEPAAVLVSEPSAGQVPAPAGQAQPSRAAAADQQWLSELESAFAAIDAGQPLPEPALPEAERAPAAPVREPEPEVRAPREPTPPPAARPPAQDRPARPTPQERPRAFGRDDVAGLLQASRQHARLVDDRIAALVAGFVDEGLAAMQRGDLPAAHQAFAHAWELDPADPAARDLYQRTRALLEGGPAGLGALARSARDRAAARAQQESVSLDHQLELGRRAMAAGDPEQARQHFEDAQSILRWQPDLADARGREREVAKLLALAGVAASDQARRREEELLQRSLRRQEEADRTQATRTERRVRALVDGAEAAFLRDDFEATVASLDEALRLDPDHAGARELKRTASAALHRQRSRGTRETFRRSWQDTMDELERDLLPVNSVISFPQAEDWAAVSERGTKSFVGAGGDADASAAAIRARLAEVRIPLSFDEVTLDDVIAHLSEVTGVNFLISQDARDASEDNTYSLQDRAEQPVERVLKIILEDLSLTPLTYTVRDHVVQLITEDEFRSDLVLELYDVRDLSFVPRDYRTEDFNLLPSGTDPDSFRPDEDEEPLPLIGEDNLAQLIQDNIAPESWTEGDPPRTIDTKPGTLVINQTPEVHALIRRLLDDLRAGSNTLIHIETRFVEVEDSFLEDIGVDLRGLDSTILEDFGTSGVGFGTPTAPSGIGTDNEAGFFYTGPNGDLKGRVENLFDHLLGEPETLSNAGGLWMQALFLDDTDVNLVLRAVTKYETSNVVNAPSLTMRSGQRGAIEVLSSRTYVWDYEPEIAQSAVIAQPELQNAKEGIQLDVKAVASADRRFITLEIRPTLAELLRDASGDVFPEETVSLAAGNASEVTIQLPSLRIQRLRTMATVPDGATLMLGGLKKSVEQDVESSVPFLGDIPILGFLFKRKGEYTSQRKLLILLKASIIVPEEEEPRLAFRG